MWHDDPWTDDERRIEWADDLNDLPDDDQDPDA